MDLSKRDKKTAREIIETSLIREMTSGLEEVESFLGNWKSRNQDVKETYHTLYKMIKNLDKRIGRRYDGITGSWYLPVVVGLVRDGIVSQDELTEFSEEVRAIILGLSE